MKSDTTPKETVRLRFFKQFHQNTADLFRVVIHGSSSKMEKCFHLILVLFWLTSVLISLNHQIIQQSEVVGFLYPFFWVLICINCIGYYVYTNSQIKQSSIKKDPEVQKEQC
jgi:hypothetical protein